ncbi:hypothetical protein PR003_g11280 [Phytophthora rubi]|uniref:Secreted protein n=1 Tax=Phytophthora rubi TaxID=129364 RepID=A0A6A4F8P2_9STRA|nr:hypothetical protein PR002_g11019 [Phytophthora rubi]KAE9032031.1 hypothetical protein PR001_g10786 [Phytophthora rubi]KAE9338894.1 hypothetical protein PR003_g11280 [Phytophthora rubi]
MLLLLSFHAAQSCSSQQVRTPEDAKQDRKKVMCRRRALTRTSPCINTFVPETIISAAHPTVTTVMLRKTAPPQLDDRHRACSALYHCTATRFIILYGHYVIPAHHSCATETFFDCCGQSSGSARCLAGKMT